MEVTTTVTETKVMCDLTGRELRDSGWELRRRSDGKVIQVRDLGTLQGYSTREILDAFDASSLVDEIENVYVRNDVPEFFPLVDFRETL